MTFCFVFCCCRFRRFVAQFFLSSVLHTDWIVRFVCALKRTNKINGHRENVTEECLLHFTKIARAHKTNTEQKWNESGKRKRKCRQKNSIDLSAFWVYARARFREHKIIDIWNECVIYTQWMLTIGRFSSVVTGRVKEMKWSLFEMSPFPMNFNWTIQLDAIIHVHSILNAVVDFFHLFISFFIYFFIHCQSQKRIARMCWGRATVNRNEANECRHQLTLRVRLGSPNVCIILSHRRCNIIMYVFLYILHFDEHKRDSRRFLCALEVRAKYKTCPSQRRHYNTRKI